MAQEFLTGRSPPLPAPPLSDTTTPLSPLYLGSMMEKLMNDLQTQTRQLNLEDRLTGSDGYVGIDYRGVRSCNRIRETNCWDGGFRDL